MDQLRRYGSRKKTMGPREIKTQGVKRKERNIALSASMDDLRSADGFEDG